MVNLSSPPIWLGIIAILITLLLVSYTISTDIVEGFRGPNRYLSGFWYDHYSYPPHSYQYYDYPPPNPYLYPSVYHPSHYYIRSYVPRYIPYYPLDPRLPTPVNGYTSNYYYDKYRQIVNANKAANPYKYHYDAEGELIPSEDALYYKNYPVPELSSWWSGWLY